MTAEPSAKITFDLNPPFVVQLTTGRATIGRSQECSVTVPNDKISKQHAAIETTDEGWILEDLGSRNGTHVNGVKVEDRISLPNVAQIRFGRVSARFECAIPEEHAQQDRSQQSPAQQSDPQADRRGADLGSPPHLPDDERQRAIHSASLWASWTRTLWYSVWIGIAVMLYLVTLRKLGPGSE